MKTYPNVLILRLRMPVSDDLHPRNFVTKISQYDRVVNIPNVSTGCKPCYYPEINLTDSFF